MSELKAALDRLASTRRLLVALDFDGVLAPIVDVPSAARPLPEAAAALSDLAALPKTTVALVSGRGLTDLATVSGFGTPIRLVGSHGAEFDDGATAMDDEARVRLERLVAEVTALVGHEAGVRLEHKPTGIAVHVRGADDAVAQRVLDAVGAGPAAAEGVVATPGKAVLDLAVVEVSKGAAIDQLRDQLSADAVLFAGDDVTDETGFARLRDGDVGVKVGDGDTAAAFRVPDPAAVADLLKHLVSARASA
ncbi:trehalose-phosphatase [Pseudonocardia sp. CA-107938]|uniref:trehalose-phosphatase n=1 Tax=Pseudonocardia sp. CA-107938 TaxID=3240021 RepID=UPI003D8D534B